MRAMRNVTEQLTAARLLVELQGDVPSFHPASPLDRVTLGSVIGALNKAGDESPQTAKALERLGVLDALERHEQAVNPGKDLTLLDLARSCKGPGFDDEETA